MKKRLIILLVAVCLYAWLPGSIVFAGKVLVDVDVRDKINDTSSITADFDCLEIKYNQYKAYSGATYTLPGEALTIISSFQTESTLYLYIHSDIPGWLFTNELNKIEIADADAELTMRGEYAIQKVSTLPTGLINKYKVLDYQIAENDELYVKNVFYTPNGTSMKRLDGYSPYYFVWQIKDGKYSSVYHHLNTVNTKGVVAVEEMAEAAKFKSNTWITLTQSKAYLFAYSFDVLNVDNTINKTLRDQLVSIDLSYRITQNFYQYSYYVEAWFRWDEHRSVTSIGELQHQKIVDEQKTYTYYGSSGNLVSNLLGLYEKRTKSIHTLSSVYDPGITEAEKKAFNGHTYKVYFGNLEEGYPYLREETFYGYWWVAGIKYSSVNALELSKLTFFDTNAELYYSVNVDQTEWTFLDPTDPNTPQLSSPGGSGWDWLALLAWVVIGIPIVLLITPVVKFVFDGLGSLIRRR